jgi:predicted nuclease of restriction endonuclease-like RecB superfamily
MALIRCGKVKVSDLLHFSAVKIQVKHLDHFLRIYIKVLGKDTIYRIEELKQSKISAVEYINDVFNPTEKIGTRLYGIYERLDKLTSFQGPVDNGGA